MKKGSVFDLIYRKNSVLTKEIINLLKEKGEMISFRAGEYLLKEGGLSKYVYIILQGEIEIIKSSGGGIPKKIAILGEGAIVGEMGIFLNLRHSASVVAKTAVKAVKFSSEDFLDTALRVPYVGVRLYKSLIGRLDDSNKKNVGLLKEKNYLKVASYLLGIENRTYVENFVTLDLKKVASMLNVELEELEMILSSFEQRRLLGEYELDFNKIAHFKIKVKNLLSYIKNI